MPLTEYNPRARGVIAFEALLDTILEMRTENNLREILEKVEVMLS